MTKTSVIIRTKNEAAHIGATLDRVLSQRTPPHEIIVIDSGSTDRTLDIARGYPVTIMHIKAEEWSYSRAINRAAEQATGDILICLSAHCQPVHDDWLDRLSMHFADPLVVGVWGPGINPADDLPALTPPERQVGESYAQENRSYGLSNANSAVRRSLWADCPFDETMPAVEDKAWGKAMLDRGLVIIHDPAVIVWHEPHGAKVAFRRNQAIQAGYRMMFPDLPGHGRNQVGTVLRRGASIVHDRARERNVRRFSRDLGRLPAIAASLGGGVRASVVAAGKRQARRVSSKAVHPSVRPLTDRSRDDQGTTSSASTTPSHVGAECSDPTDHFRREVLRLHERLGWYPGHWYSPYPDIGELEPRYADIVDPSVDSLAAIDLATSRQLAHLHGLCAATSPTLADLSFPMDNDAYRAGDALVLLRQLQHHPPRRVVEIGSGYSTALIQAIRREAVIPAFEHIVIDPWPEKVFEVIEPGLATTMEIIESPVQAVDVAMAETLESDDVLFVDSSHVSKPGSDLNVIIFDWLPRLAKSVRVHFHDIYFPFEYPWDWIQQGRAWNEAFVLRAFLQFNRDFEIRLFTNQLSKQHPEQMQQLGHEFETTGSSLWIQRCATSASDKPAKLAV